MGDAWRALQARSFKERFRDPFLYQQRGFEVSVAQRAPLAEGAGADPLDTGSTV